MNRELDLDYDTRLNMHYPIAVVEQSTLRNLVTPVREEHVRGYIDAYFAISGDTLARVRHEQKAAGHAKP